MDEEREALLRWAYDAVAATTWDELIAAHKRHGKDDLLVNGLEMQRERAQRAGRAAGFERQTLEGSRAGFLKSPPFPPSGANMATAGRQARPPSCKALSRRHSFEVFQGVTGSSRRRSGRCQPTLSERAGRLIQARGKRKSDGRAKGFTWGAQKPTRPSRLYPLGGAPNGHRTACNILLRAAEVKACMLQNLYRCVVKDRSFQARRR